MIITCHFEYESERDLDLDRESASSAKVRILNISQRFNHHHAANNFTKAGATISIPRLSEFAVILVKGEEMLHFGVILNNDWIIQWDDTGFKAKYVLIHALRSEEGRIKFELFFANTFVPCKERLQQKDISGGGVSMTAPYRTASPTATAAKLIDELYKISLSHFDYNCGDEGGKSNCVRAALSLLDVLRGEEPGSMYKALRAKFGSVLNAKPPATPDLKAMLQFVTSGAESAGLRSVGLSTERIQIDSI
eukprot:Selendium_serpulae@DN6220_c1_g1_i6.p1